MSVHGNRVSIAIEGLEEPVWLASCPAYILAMLDALGRVSWDLSILFCDDTVIAGLNEEFRKKEGPTDVLSFDQGEWYDEGSTRRFLAGDIAISVPAALRNAGDFGVSAEEEVGRLLLHGILHLSGMDHRTNDENEPMLAFQEDFLKNFTGVRLG